MVVVALAVVVVVFAVVVVCSALVLVAGRDDEVEDASATVDVGGTEEELDAAGLSVETVAVAEGCVGTVTDVEDSTASSSPPHALRPAAMRTRRSRTSATGMAPSLKRTLIVGLRFAAQTRFPGVGKRSCSTCYNTYGIRNRLIS